MTGSFVEQVNERQLEILKRGWLHFVGFVLAWSLPYIYIDLNYPESTGPIVLMSLVGIALNFWILYSAMSLGDGFEAGARTGIASFFGLSIIHSLGVGLAALLLILPGLFLIVRWLPAFARLLDSEEGITAAMAWSWNRTQDDMLALALAFVGPLIFYGVGFGLLFYQGFAYETLSNQEWESVFLWTTIVANIALSIALAWYTLLGVAAYICLKEPVVGIEETFA